MKVTKLLLLKKFDEYNMLYFDSKLGSCQFSFTGKNNSAYGTYRRWRASDGKEKNRISIGRCIIWNEESLREILVHEMIHMYVETVERKHYDGLFGHGWQLALQATMPTHPPRAWLESKGASTLQAHRQVTRA